MHHRRCSSTHGSDTICVVVAWSNKGWSGAVLTVSLLSCTRKAPVAGGGAEPASDVSIAPPDFRTASGSSTATAEPPPIPPAPPPPKPVDCHALRQCVRSTFPRVFDAQSFAARKHELEACFGSNKAEWFQAEDCGPVEFSRDVAKNLAVEAYAECSDVCPGATTVQARYVDVSKAECVCLGGTRHEVWPRHFAGCMPFPAVMVTRREATGKPRTEPTTEVPLELLGFTLYDTVKEVDGLRTTPQPALDMIKKLPDALPRSIVVEGRKYKKRIRFVRQREIERLRAALGPDLSRQSQPSTPVPCSQSGYERSVFVDDLEFPYIPGCPGATNERLKALSALIEALFRAPATTAPRPQATSISCELVHDQPIGFGVDVDGNPGDRIELRWVDWMRPPIVTP
jgi:hypothetical protein